jgi:hypothetical protein
MELKIWGVNLGAIFFSIVNNINPFLSTLVLIASLIYTVLQIKEKLKK